MEEKKSFIKKLQETFGSQKITSIDEMKQLSKDINLAVNVYSQQVDDDFKRRLEVNSNKPTISANYVTLSEDIKRKLEKSFDKYSNAILSNEEIKKNILKQQNEGFVGDTPL